MVNHLMVICIRRKTIDTSVTINLQGLSRRRARPIDKKLKTAKRQNKYALSSQAQHVIRRQSYTLSHSQFLIFAGCLPIPFLHSSGQMHYSEAI